MTEERAEELLRTAEYGVLSLVTEDGRPYGVPLNYVWDGEDAIYIHCAPEGRKLEAIGAAGSAASFCIVGRVSLVPSQFTTGYESVVVSGTVRTGLSAEEKMKALKLLIAKLSPADQEVGAQYAQKSFHRVEVIRMDCEEYSGKNKIVR